MSASNNINSLVGAATRYIAGRNAVQTVYWRRSSQSPNAKMLKYNRTCEFDRSQKLPPHLRLLSYNRNFAAAKKNEF